MDYQSLLRVLAAAASRSRFTMSLTATLTSPSASRAASTAAGPSNPISLSSSTSESHSSEEDESSAGAGHSDVLAGAGTVAETGGATGVGDDSPFFVFASAGASVVGSDGWTKAWLGGGGSWLPIGASSSSAPDPGLTHAMWSTARSSEYTVPIGVTCRVARSASLASTGR